MPANPQNAAYCLTTTVVADAHRIRDFQKRNNANAE
jgi:hypothetical protein